MAEVVTALSPDDPVDVVHDRGLCKYMAVYGTLLSGFHNNILLDGARLVDNGQSEFWGTMFSAGGFPILSLVEPSSKIEVEIWEIPEGTEGENIFEALDALEGYPGWYQRAIKTFSIKGEKIKAWIYHQPIDGRALFQVESGCWRTHVQGNRV